MFGTSSQMATLASPSSTPLAPYVRRPPSPPMINVWEEERDLRDGVLAPEWTKMDITQITPRELQLITGNRRQKAEKNPCREWTYEKRRDAQAVFDFLFLGPTTALRNHDFLRENGITMVIIIRDAMFVSQRFASVERVQQELGIEVKFVDISNVEQITHFFPDFIRMINDHLLAPYRGRTDAYYKAQHGGRASKAPESTPPRRVLVTCETGNDRSAAFVVAYIMACFGTPLSVAIKFVSLQRFCSVFSEEVKRRLQTWGDLIRARAEVARATIQSNMDVEEQEDATATKKRHIEDTMDVDMSEPGEGNGDDERFQGRSFVPFMDED